MLAPTNGDDREAFDRIVETMIVLSTESRPLTKDPARAYALTSEQLTVIPRLAGIGERSFTELSQTMQTRNSAVSAIIDRTNVANGWSNACGTRETRAL